MDEKTEDDNSDDKKKKRKAPRRKKKQNLPIHDEKIIQPDHIPDGARFKAYKDIIIQDIVIKPYNTRYLLGLRIK